MHEHPARRVLGEFGVEGQDSRDPASAGGVGDLPPCAWPGGSSERNEKARETGSPPVAEAGRGHWFTTENTLPEDGPHQILPPVLVGLTVSTIWPLRRRRR